MDFADYPLPLIFVGSLIAIFIASEIGRQLGLLASRRQRENISTIEGAILGLLALLIAFTFSMALSRFEVRRDAVVNEANAIGTTALRARLLPTPYNTDSLKLLREYIQIRLDLTKRIVTAPDIAAAIMEAG
jgi:cellobiose-specific phosphotransferase system component IIC